jgi:hypothetical protein
MPKRCTICTHPQREAIDKALIAGQSLRNISENVPQCSVTSLHRHKEHLPRELARAREAEQISSADSLLDQVQALQAKAMAILNTAERSGNLRVALAAIREARGNLELLARLLGELKETGTTVNVLVSPAWVSLRTLILEALEPFPEARLKLSQALGEAGHANG